MSRLKIPDPSDFDLKSFGEMLWQRLPLPGEEAGSFEIFREQMTRELQPYTPYEAVLADHLVAIEWELREHRRMRDAAVRSGVMDAARDALVASRRRAHELEVQAACEAQYDGVDEDGVPWQAEGDALVAQLGSGAPDQLAEADRVLASLGTSRLALMGRVWRRLSDGIALHEDAIRDLERRRRELQRDLEQLQRKRPIEAAPSP
jgi:hypothetical protein